MNFDEALEILGIDRSVGKKGARRAYLKLIKVHKPDRDPVMFRRVREAYECVKDQIEVFARFYTPAPEAHPPEPERHGEAPEISPTPYFESVLERTEAYDALLGDRAGAPPSTPDPAPPETPPPDEAPPPDETPPPDEAPLTYGPDWQPWLETDNRSSRPKLERLRTKSAEIDPLAPPQVDLLDDPLRIDPHAERPIRIEPRSAPPDAAPAPIRQAPARAFERRPSPAALLARAWRLFNDGGQAQAVERLARRAFTTAHIDPQAAQPPPADAINLCLALFTNGRIIQARRLTRAMRAWLSETGLERRVMGEKLAARVAILQALLDLPPDSPTFPIARVARAMRDGALDSAHAPLRRFTHETPFSALTSAEHFRAYAPLLDGLYGEILRAGAAVELAAVTDEVPARRGRGCLWLGAAMLIFFGLGLLVRTCDGPRQRPTRLSVPSISIPSFDLPKFEVPPIKVPRITLPSGSTRDTPAADVNAADARRVRDFSSGPSTDAMPVAAAIWRRILCKAGDDFQASACDAARSLEAAVNAQRCDAALSALRVLDHTQLADTAQRGAVVLARQHYELTCPKR